MKEQIQIDLSLALQQLSNQVAELSATKALQAAYITQLEEHIKELEGQA